MCTNAPSHGHNFGSVAASQRVHKCPMDDDQVLTRRWLMRVKSKTGLDYSAIAREAGISHTTLTRFMSRADIKYTLSARTIGKIVRRFGVDPPQPDIIGGKMRVSQETARMIALRKTVSPDVGMAAKMLHVTTAELITQESGAVAHDPAYLLRLLEITDSKPSWISKGDPNSLGTASLILISRDAPELVPSVAPGPEARNPRGDKEGSASG